MLNNFVQTDADKSRDVRNALNSSRQKAVDENRNRRSHIIRTIEFCGRQEMPLMGHRHAGAFSLNETDCNDGGFKAALRLRVEAADKQTSDLFFKGLEGLRSRLGLEGFRSRALRLETLYRLFFMKFCEKEFLKKRFLKNDCSIFFQEVSS